LGRQGIDGEDPPLAGNPYAAGLGDQPADTTPLNPRIVLGLDYGTTYSGTRTINMWTIRILLSECQ
jgi:hypothetical protein